MSSTEPEFGYAQYYTQKDAVECVNDETLGYVKRLVCEKDSSSLYSLNLF